MDKEFEKLWDEFSEELTNYIKSRVANSYDAEDILQDVFIKIFRNIDKVEHKAAIKSWLYTLTKNTIIDYYKKKKDLVTPPEKLLLIEEEDFTEDNMNEEMVACLKHMVFDLPEKYRQVYDLHENQQMKHREIGEALDISLSASKVRLKRAKEHFKKNLIECCDFEVDQYGNIINYKRKHPDRKCDKGCEC